MTPKQTALAAALFTCGLASAPAHSQSSPEFKLGGFGTLAATHSSENRADYTGTLRQPNGAGMTDSWSFGPESKLGAQADVKFNDKFSGVVQIISQHQYDNSWRPAVEWANVKYTPVSGLNLRLGRIALPSFLYSETRFTGYAMPWAKPPFETYNALPITSNDGIDITYRSKFGSVNNTAQAYYGRSKYRIPSGTAKANPNWGLSDFAEMGSLTVHLGYSSLDVDLDLPSLNPLFAGLAGVAAGGSLEAQYLAQKYSLKDLKLSAVSLGAMYDPGQWFVLSELVEYNGKGFVSDTRSWYVSGGYRFGPWTPYAVVGGVKAKIVPEGGTLATPFGINTTLNLYTPQQRSIALGVRWDVVKNVALKAQYDRVTLKNGSNGRFSGAPLGTTIGPRVNLVTIAADFVF